jgi:hypothetical protein
VGRALARERGLYGRSGTTDAENVQRRCAGANLRCEVLDEGWSEEGSRPTVQNTRGDEEEQGEQKREHTHHRHAGVVVSGASGARHVAAARGTCRGVHLGRCVVGGRLINSSRHRHRRRRFGGGSPVQVQGVHRQEADDDSGDEHHTRQHTPEDAGGASSGPRRRHRCHGKKSTGVVGRSRLRICQAEGLGSASARPGVELPRGLRARPTCPDAPRAEPCGGDRPTAPPPGMRRNRHRR